MTKIIRDIEVSIPEGVDARIDRDTITIKGKKGEINRTLAHPRLTLRMDNQKLHVTCTEKKPTIRDKMMINTFRAHIRNMIHGVQEGYHAKLKVCSGHFPITVSADATTVTIKNFLGEKKQRTAAIYPGVKAKVEGDIISLEGIDKDAVGQSAARIENSTRIANRDRRIFQDGCYIIQKPGDDA